MKDNQKRESPEMEPHDNGQQAKERLREYERVVEGLEEMITVVDRDYRYLIANPAFLHHRGMGRDQVVGHYVSEVLGQEIFEKIVKQKLDECFQGRVVEYEMRYTYPTLGERDLLISYFPIEGPGGVDRVACILQDITERKRVENALREAEQKYREIFENAGEGIFQSTPEGRFLDANPAFARMHGFDSPEDLIRSWDDISRQIYSDPARREEFKRLLAADGIVRGFEHQVFRRDGSRIWISVNARAVRDEGGAIRYYEGIAQNIDERKRAEARSAAFATLARKLSGVRTPLDAGTIIAQTAADLLEWDSFDLNLYDADRDLVHPMLNIDMIDGRQTHITPSISDRAPTARSRRVIAHGPELLLREEPVQFDKDTIPFGDRTRPSASLMTVPIRHAARVVGLLSVQSYTPHKYDGAALADLDALADHCGEALNRIRAEESLTESEERFRQMADHFEDVIFIADKDITKILYINPAHEKIYGRSSESLYERLDSFVEAVHPEDRDRLARNFRDKRNGDHHPFEYRIVRPDGSIRWILGRSFPIRNKEGEVYRVGGIGQDITERKRADEALRESEERYRDLVENSRELICTHDLDGRILSANRAATEVLGSDKKDYSGNKNLREILAPEIRDQFGTYLARIRKEGFATGLMLVQTSSGERRIWEYYNTLRSEGVATPIVRGMARDITDRKRTEEALRASEKRFRTLIENSSDAIVLLDVDGMIIDHAPRTGSVMGYANESLVGRNVLEMIHPEDRALVRQVLDEVLTGEAQRITLQFRALHRNGSSRWGEGVAANHLGDPEIRAIVVNYRDITERKRSEESLRKQNEYLAALHETALGLLNRLDLKELLEVIVTRACALVDIPSGYVYLLEPGGNEMSVKVGVGVSRDFVGALISKGQGVAGRIWETGQPLVVDDYRNWEHRLPIAGYDALRLVGAVPLRSGSRVVGVLGVESTEDGQGLDQHQIEILNRFAQLASIALDNAQLHSAAQQELAERKRTEEEVSNLRGELELTMNSMEEGIHRMDMKGNIAFENPAAARMLGWEVDELLGKYAHSTMHHTRTDGTPYPKEECPIYATLRDGISRHVTDEVFWRQDGTSFPVEYMTAPMRNDRNEIVATVVTFRDITDRKRAEDTLRESEERYRSLFVNMLNGFAYCKVLFEHEQAQDFIYLEVNDAFEKLTGFKDVVGKKVTEIIPGIRESDPELFETYGRVALTGRPETFEIYLASLDTWHAVSLYSPRKGYFVSVFDVITERKRAEAALRESEERYRELFENAKDAIYVHDLSGRYTSVNRAAEQMSGFSREQIMGKHFSNFVSPRDLKHARTNLCRKLDEENETIYEVDMVTRTGQRVPVEVSSRLIYENGVAIGVQGTARDITERKRAQEALQIYSQRLIQAQEAEREKIARELHDEIGQVLTAVKINLQSVQHSCRTADCVPRLAESIAIVDEALGCVRELSIELRPSLLDDLGLTAALRWYVDHYAQRTGIIAEVLDGSKEDSRLPRELETACFRIAQEALTNVARHARAGSVSVQLERSRERMLLTIIDDGVGFDVDKLRKSASAATALGLRGMEERALAVGGYIKIDSGLERGTQIHATFPLKRK